MCQVNLCKLKFGRNQKSCFVGFQTEKYLNHIERNRINSKTYSYKKGPKKRREEEDREEDSETGNKNNEKIWNDTK